MAECNFCGEDMLVSNGCTASRTITFADGEETEPIPFGSGLNQDPHGKCHDCGAFPGHYHHPGCDMEKCPRCGGQYFICECATDEKEVIWGDA